MSPLLKQQARQSVKRRWTMLEGVHGSRRVTLGADKGYDTQDFITTKIHHLIERTLIS